MDVAGQEALLRALIEAHRQERLDAIEAATLSRERSIVGEAFAAARERIREVFVEERARRGDEIALAEARLAARRRQASERRAALLLARAWAGLPGAVAAAWSDAQSRARWTARALVDARRALPAGRWRVEVPEDWVAEERRSFVDAVGALAGEAPQVESRAGAGVRLSCAGNCVDATIEGLLAERDAVSARLLHLVRQCEGRR